MSSRRYTVSPRCECQALLSTELDEHRHALAGWAFRGGVKEPAPAHRINASHDRFDIGWLCNFCGRNTLRSFYAGALKRMPAEPAQPAQPLPEAASKSA